MSLELKEAVRLAVGAVTESFESQKLENILLEEVEDDESGGWLITVGFDRMLENTPMPTQFVTMAQRFKRERRYKVVKINSSGRVKSIKDRTLDK